MLPQSVRNLGGSFLASRGGSILESAEDDTEEAAVAALRCSLTVG
jgi:hypothetical protein